MPIAINDDADEMKVRFGERLTFSDHEEFGEVLNAIEESRQTAITFDFSASTFIDSSALGMLLIAKDVAGERGASITLAGANADIRRLFDLGTFSEFFTIVD